MLSLFKGGSNIERLLKESKKNVINSFVYQKIIIKREIIISQIFNL